LAKEIVLDIPNGRSAYSIFSSLQGLGFGIDLDDVQGFLLCYRGEFEGIERWQNEIVEAARGSGAIQTPLRRLLRVTTDSPVNSLYNFPVQATAADGFKNALVAMDRGIQGFDARIVHILYDEVIVEARVGEAGKVAGIVKGAMEDALAMMLPGMPLGVEAEVRGRWGG
jgi:DNA polymerase I-like protein with 3'-5' exonuclease and polymerase domains